MNYRILLIVFNDEIYSVYYLYTVMDAMVFSHMYICKHMHFWV